jgi:hypothetical protein
LRGEKIKMDNAGKFNVGTKFIGNVNKAKMEVVKIENKQYGTASGRLRTEHTKAVIKDLKTGRTFAHGLQMLERCDVTIIEN